MKHIQRGPKLAAQMALACLMLFSPSIGLSTRLETMPPAGAPEAYPFDQRSPRPPCYLKVQSYDGGAGPLEDDVIDSLSKDLDVKHTDVDGYYRNCPQAGDCHTIFITFSNGKTEVGVRCGITRTQPEELPCAQRTDRDSVFCKRENLIRAIEFVKKHLIKDNLTRVR